MLEEEIKKVKKEQQKYYVPSILEERLPYKVSIDDSKNTLEKSSFSLVKKLIKRI